MKLSHRAMQPGDIPECLDIVANHPVFGSRYGPAIEHLPEAWLRLLKCEAGNTMVTRDSGDPRARICIFGISAIVGDDFLRDLKTPPHFWVGPELTRRIMRGESPFLTGKQIREINSRDGLNLVCWEGCVHPEYEAYGEVQRYTINTFIHEHRGYLWKEVIGAQSWGPEHLDWILKTGGYLWDPLAGGYTSTLRTDPGEIVTRPHVVGITRDLELKRQSNWTGSWVGAIFDYHPPILGFSQNEKHLLSCALAGHTDEHLANMLGTSLPAVKKRWVSIYRRVEDILPELIGDSIPTDIPASGRGREKRRRLLGYLREHPEEMRPVLRASRKRRAQTNVGAP